MSEEVEKDKCKLAKANQKVEILEQMLEEKVRDLYLKSNKELAKQNKELEFRNKEMMQFTYIASPDLQEPLRNVSSFLEILDLEKGEVLGEDGRKHLSFIRNANECQH
jgi:chemotaxis family two-component system sensor kinase Cph1